MDLFSSCDNVHCTDDYILDQCLCLCPPTLPPSPQAVDISHTLEGPHKELAAFSSPKVLAPP